ncbi:hypothetical protein ACFSNO_27600 [Streptomyces cirratus]
MPRGRHRNPEPLHRLLTPTALAGVSVAGAGAAWLLAEPLALRLLVALTAAAGVAGAVVMRSWDRSAGRRWRSSPESGSRTSGRRKSG